MISSRLSIAIFHRRRSDNHIWDMHQMEYNCKSSKSTLTFMSHRWSVEVINITIYVHFISSLFWPFLSKSLAILKLNVIRSGTRWFACNVNGVPIGHICTNLIDVNNIACIMPYIGSRAAYMHIVYLDKRQDNVYVRWWTDIADILQRVTDYKVVYTICRCGHFILVHIFKLHPYH